MTNAVSAVWHSSQLLIALLWNARSRLWALVLRDLRSQYAGSSLGVYWALLRPLLQIAAYYFAFGIVLEARLGKEQGGADYAVYLLSGLIPWMCFREGVSKGSHSLVADAALIKKVRVPFELLTAKAVLAPALAYLPFIVLVWALTAASVEFASLTFLLPWMVLQIFFTFYLVHCMALLTAVMRDIGETCNVVVGMLIFFSPVLFPMSRVPDGFKLLMYINPMTPIVEGYHSIVLAGQLPSAGDVLAGFVWLAVMAGIATALHERARENLADWL